MSWTSSPGVILVEIPPTFANIAPEFDLCELRTPGFPRPCTPTQTSEHVCRRRADAQQGDFTNMWQCLGANYRTSRSGLHRGRGHRSQSPGGPGKMLAGMGLAKLGFGRSIVAEPTAMDRRRSSNRRVNDTLHCWTGHTHTHKTMRRRNGCPITRTCLGMREIAATPCQPL